LHEELVLAESSMHRLQQAADDNYVKVADVEAQFEASAHPLEACSHCFGARAHAGRLNLGVSAWHLLGCVLQSELLGLQEAMARDHGRYLDDLARLQAQKEDLETEQAERANRVLEQLQQCEEQLQAGDKEIERLQKTLRAAQEAHARELTALDEEHNRALAQLRAQHSTELRERTAALREVYQPSASGDTNRERATPSPSGDVQQTIATLRAEREQLQLVRRHLLVTPSGPRMHGELEHGVQAHELARGTLGDHRSAPLLRLDSPKRCSLEMQQRINRFVVVCARQCDGGGYGGWRAGR
jgi:myosin heavy subunit